MFTALAYVSLLLSDYMSLLSYTCITTSQRYPYFVKDLKLICFANHILTLILNLNVCIYPHSGFEIALLLRPL